MKKTILFLFATLVTLSSFAQKEVKNVNVDNLRFSYKERNLPKKNFDPMFFYYTSQFLIHPSLEGVVGNKELADQLQIIDQRKAKNERGANMLVRVSMLPIEIIEFKVERRMEDIKNKRGETIRKRIYWLEVAYSFAASADIVDKKSSTIVSKYEIQNRKETRIFRGREYDNVQAAEIYWDNNEGLIMEEIIRAEMLGAVERLNVMLEKDYSFLISNKAGLIKTINEKNHPENQNLREKSSSLAATLTKLNGTHPLQLERVEDELNYFMRIPQRYQADTKPDIRLRYVAYYNICRIYLFLEQPKNVERWANLLYENGFDTKDRERLVKDAINLQQALNNPIGTLQFDPQDYIR